MYGCVFCYPIRVFLVLCRVCKVNIVFSFMLEFQNSLVRVLWCWTNVLQGRCILRFLARKKKKSVFGNHLSCKSFSWEGTESIFLFYFLRKRKNNYDNSTTTNIHSKRSTAVCYRRLYNVMLIAYFFAWLQV